MTEVRKEIDLDAPELEMEPPVAEIENQDDEDSLDEALEETFPASDPIAPSQFD